MNMILEEKIKRWFTELMDINNIIHPHQFGFVKGSNTLAATSQLMQYVTKSISEGKWTAVLFFDIRKAFDCVSTQLLTRKKEKLHLAPNEQGLLKSYATNRT